MNEAVASALAKFSQTRAMVLSLDAKIHRLRGELNKAADDYGNALNLCESAKNGLQNAIDDEARRESGVS